MKSITSKYSGIIALILLVGILGGCNDTRQEMNDYLLQGRNYLETGDYEKAQTAFRQALQLDPRNIGVLSESAEVSVKLGDMQRASEYYQTIAEVDSEHLIARVKLGQFYLLARRIDDAERMAQEALAIDAEDPDVLVLSGSVSAARNDNDDASMKAEAALSRRPGYVPAVLLLSSIRAKSGKLEEALDFTRQHVEQDPTDVSLRLMLANLYAKAGAFNQAEQALKAIIALEPTLLIHRKRLASFLVGLGQIDAAEGVLRDAVIDLPGDQQAKVSLLDFLAEKRGPEIAEAELIPMLEDHPDDLVLKFGLANLYLARNLTEKAEQVLSEIVETDSSAIQVIKAKNKLARLYAGTGRTRQAADLIESVIQADPNESEARLLRGELAFAENRFADAIRDFRAVLTVWPNNPSVLRLLAAAHKLDQNPVAAMGAIVEVIQLLPQDEGARLELAELLVKTGHIDRAVQHIQALLRLNPESKRGLESLFKIYQAQQQWEQARQTAELLQKNLPDEAVGYYLAGLAYSGAGKHKDAVASFDKALTKQADAIEPLTQLVSNYLQAKQVDQALAKLEGIVKRQPQHFVAYNLMGGVYVAINKPAEATKAFNKAIEIRPEWEIPYRNLTTIYLHQGNEAQAIKTLQTGIDKTASTALVGDLVAIYYRNGSHDEAIALLEEDYRKKPQSAVALNNLVRYLAEQTQSDATLERAVELAEPLTTINHPEMLYTIAVLAYRQEQYDRAQELLLKIIKQVADSPLVHYRLGMVYHKQGDDNRAKEHLKRAVEKNENFHGLEEARQTLKELL